MYYSEPAPEVISYDRLLEVMNERRTQKPNLATAAYSMNLMHDLLILAKKTRLEADGLSVDNRKAA
ncbi:MAG TPA: hypothetical protein V6C72_09635 [Chroococcales cyanobacterium]